MTQWYYADRQRQQQGPVDATGLAAAFAAGEVTAASLVWREGLAGWVPLTQVAAELGIEVPRTAATTPPAAAARRPPRVVAPARSGVATWVIVVAVLGVGVLFVGGILAAIAIPAYSDYKIRFRVSEALALAMPLRTDVHEFYLAENRCPANADAGFGAPESYASATITRIEIGPDVDGACAIEVVLADLGADTAGKRIRLALQDERWTSRSSVSERYLPASLRGRPRL